MKLIHIAAVEKIRGHRHILIEYICSNLLHDSAKQNK